MGEVQTPPLRGSIATQNEVHHKAGKVFSDASLSYRWLKDEPLTQEC